MSSLLVDICVLYEIKFAATGGDIGLAVMIFVIQLLFLGVFCAFDCMNDLRWLLTLHAATGLR